MIAELRELARTPVTIFERFMGQLQQLTGDKGVPAPVGLERVRELQAAAAREMEECVQRFREKVAEAEARLLALLRPGRPDLYEEIQRLTNQLQVLRNLAVRREALREGWDAQPADAILEGYRGALERQDVETAELYEACAEPALRRKGDAAVLQAFLEMRAQAEEARLTPAQRQARAELGEIERLKNEVTLATRILSSTLRASGSLAAAGAGWRRGNRVRLTAGEQARTPVQILPGPHPPISATLVDVSYTGVRLALPQELPPGTVLSFVVKVGDGPDGEVRMRGEVRWCRVDVRTQGLFLAGVRLVSRVGDPWVALVGRLAESQSSGAPAAGRAEA